MKECKRMKDSNLREKRKKESRNRAKGGNDKMTKLEDNKRACDRQTDRQTDRQHEKYLKIKKNN